MRTSSFPLAILALAGLSHSASAGFKDWAKAPLLDRLRGLIMPERAPQPATLEEQERRQRRIRAVGQILLLVMDEKIGATEAQREQLQPLAERLVQGQPTFFPARGGDVYVMFPAFYFYGCATRATDEQLSPILDPLQVQRWQAACRDGTRGTVRLVPNPNLTAVPGPPSATTRLWEPEDYEEAISNYLEKQSATMAAAARTYMTLKAEELTRVGGLAPEQGQRMRLAALGAAEAWLGQWRAHVERMVRAGLDEADALNVKKQLDGLELTRYPQLSLRLAERQPLWEEALVREAQPSQRDAWKKELDLRAAFRLRAITALVLTELDRRAELSPAQWEKFEPALQAAVSKFEQDIAGDHADGMQSGWYQSSSLLLAPLADFIAELEATLNDDQMKRLTSSREYQNALSIRASLQRNRQLRAP